jgi:hypothetical protein
VDEYPLHRVGITDVEWHIKVVAAAIRKRGKYLKKQIVSRDGSCAALVDFPNEMYIVDGILNRSFYFKNRDGGEWRSHEETEDDNDGSWRHCILVKDRRIRCLGVHKSGISVLNLHLNEHGLLFVDSSVDIYIS